MQELCGGIIVTKKIIAVILVIALALSVFSFTVSAANLTAAPTASTVLVNGKNIAFDAYNIEGNNYFKLRDLAYILSGTEKQFEVTWDSVNNAISLTRGRPYTVLGGEMAGKGSGNKVPTPTNSGINLEGREVRFTAYNIEGNNYFKLRDIGQAINFSVVWDGAINTIVIDTDKGYTPEGGAKALSSVFDTAGAITSTRLLQYYNLNSTERKMYDQLSAGITNFDLKIEVDSSPANEAEKNTLSRVSAILYYTHPEVFWWNGGLRYTADGSPAEDGKYYLFPVYITDGKTIQAGLSGHNYAFDYPPAADFTAAKNWVESGKAAIHNTLISLPLHYGMTTYEMELTVYDWLVNNVTYDGSDAAKHEFNTIHGALIERRVDCTGFARTLQYIMCLLGIESVVFEGIGTLGGNHHWSAVKLEGEWYYTDVAKDADMQRIDDNLPWHFHLNRNDKFNTNLGYIIGIPGAHNVNPAITCTATKYNYYVMTDTHIASDADFISKFPARIATAKANGEYAFELEFAPSYAKPSELAEKIKLIDSSIYKDLKIYYNEVGLIFCVF